MGLLLKGSGEVFHVRVNATNVMSDTTITGTNEAHYHQSGGSHTIYFFDADDSFIKVMCYLHGCSIQVKGQGIVFTDSEGMFGSWNNGGARFRNGTVFDTSGGYAVTRDTSINLAEDWKVPSAGESLMDVHSPVCESSSQCGKPTYTFDCDDSRRLGVDDIEDAGHAARRLESVFPDCNKTCDDIEVDFLREACEEDVALTSDTSWACEPSKLDPIVVESDKCDFKALDDLRCMSNDDICTRMGGHCMPGCESTDDHVCLPGLCSAKSHDSFRNLKSEKKTGKKSTKNSKEGDKNEECMCFAPFMCKA